MMNFTTRIMIVAAVFSLPLLLSSCSKDDDTTPASGGAFSVRVAPKAGFAGEGMPDTRSSVEEDGTFSWTQGDHIYLQLAYNDAAATKSVYTLVHDGTGWKTFEGALPSNSNGIKAVTIECPPAATAVDVKAFYTNCGTTVTEGVITLDYGNYGAGDVMEYTAGGVNVADPLTLSLRHTVARFSFSGLNTANACTLKGAANVKTLNTADWSTTTADAGFVNTDASLMAYATAAVSPFTVKLMDGATSVYSSDKPISLTAGTAYVMLPNTAGGINPDNNEDLLLPKPVVSHIVQPQQRTHRLNDYYICMAEMPITSEDSRPSIEDVKNDKWCAGHGDWRLPDITDWQIIFGVTETYPFYAEPSFMESDERGGHGMDPSTLSPIFFSLGCVLSSSYSETLGKIYIVDLGLPYHMLYRYSGNINTITYCVQRARPRPIVSGNEVYKVGGYYVTAPGAETDTYQWNSTGDTSAMENDPCAKHGNWRMPTAEDFEAMACWQKENPYSGGSTSLTEYYMAESDRAVFLKAFSRGYVYYWSSTVKGDNIMLFYTNTETAGRYSTGNPTREYRIRCVQKL